MHTPLIRAVLRGYRSAAGQLVLRLAFTLLLAWLVTETTSVALAQGPKPAANGGDIRTALVTLTTLAIDGLIFIGSLVFALGFAGSWIQGQIATSVGNPYGLSQSVMRILGSIITFIGLLLTIPIVNAIIGILMNNIQMGTLTPAGVK